MAKWEECPTCDGKGKVRKAVDEVHEWPPPEGLKTGTPEFEAWFRRNYPNTIEQYPTLFRFIPSGHEAVSLFTPASEGHVYGQILNAAMDNAGGRD